MCMRISIRMNDWIHGFASFFSTVNHQSLSLLLPVTPLQAGRQLDSFDIIVYKSLPLPLSVLDYIYPFIPAVIV